MDFNTIIQMAWRSIWRRKARTILSILSLWFAMSIIIFAKSVMDGTYGKMIENTVERFISEIQLHHPKWQEDKKLKYAFNADHEILLQIQDLEEVNQVSPRIRTMGLASFEDATRGVQIIGINPETEMKTVNYPEKMIEGDFLLAIQSNLCIIGDELAGKLKVQPGDSLALISYDKFGAISAVISPVGGILNVGDPQLDEFSIFINLYQAEELTYLVNQVNEVAVSLKNEKATDAMMIKLKGMLPENISAQPWYEISPETLQMIAMDKANAIFSLSLLMLIVGFGILNTVYMSIMERTREFGIMQAMGVHRSGIIKLVFVELLILVAMASISAMASMAPIVYYFDLNPINFSGEMALAYEEMGLEPVLFFSFNPAPFILSNQIVLGITLVLSIFPMNRIRKLNPVETLRIG